MAFKTNVMRLLDKAKAEYKSHCYENTDAIINIDSVLAANESQSLENTGETICHTKLVW